MDSIYRGPRVWPEPNILVDDDALTAPTPTNQLITEADLAALGLRQPFQVTAQGTSVPAGDLTSIDPGKADPTGSNRVIVHASGHAIDDVALIIWRCQVQSPLSEWPTTALSLDLRRDDAANVQFSLVVKDTTGATIDTTAPAPAVNTWEETTVLSATLAAGTFAVGDEFSVELTGTLDDTKNAYCTRPRAGA